MRTPYYLFCADDFLNNYIELETAFRDIYPDYHIAYSFKTNYTPAVCKLVLESGGFAEVVSDMEFELAKLIGFRTDQIVYNGPGKEAYFEECISDGGMLNIDNFFEVEKVCGLSSRLKNKSIGIRVNFDVFNGLHSRFGIDSSNGDLEKAIRMLNSCGVVVDGLHFHISRARSLGAWESRIVNMLQLADKVEMIQNTNLRYLDLGSGMYGHLPEELKSQFADVPTYADYASVVAKPMAAHYSNRKAKPMLITEPGTTLVSKYFSLYAQVIDIKTIRDKQFALLDCSFHNVGEICKLKKVPMKVHVRGSSERLFDSVDLVGYTCLEQDVLYSGYCGELAPGDIVEFNNVGGYSIVDKPPFIHPDIPVYMEKRGKLSCIKRAQTMDDIFIPYVF